MNRQKIFLEHANPCAYMLWQKFCWATQVFFPLEKPVGNAHSQMGSKCGERFARFAFLHPLGLNLRSGFHGKAPKVNQRAAGVFQISESSPIKQSLENSGALKAASFGSSFPEA